MWQDGLLEVLRTQGKYVSVAEVISAQSFYQCTAGLRTVSCKKLPVRENLRVSSWIRTREFNSTLGHVERLPDSQGLPEREKEDTQGNAGVKTQKMICLKSKAQDKRYLEGNSQGAQSPLSTVEQLLKWDPQPRK
ncbi:suppressor of variegation 3-7 isoform X2 [Rhodnius prolixus]|uniref:suppressor of variegation 3-7 isoform X2 n=1 Tax=Rhodnius prolixus TaxID=13249 RepID=UPI003D18A243